MTHKVEERDSLIDWFTSILEIRQTFFRFLSSLSLFISSFHFFFSPHLFICTFLFFSSLFIPSIFTSIPFLSFYLFHICLLHFWNTFFQIIILHCHTTLFLLCSQGGGVRMPKVKKTLDDYFKSSKIELGQHLNGKKRIQKEGKVERDWRQ